MYVTASLQQWSIIAVVDGSLSREGAGRIQRSLSFPTSPPTRREPTASDTCPLSGMPTRHSPEDSSSTCRQAVEEAPLRR